MAHSTMVEVKTINSAVGIDEHHIGLDSHQLGVLPDEENRDILISILISRLLADQDLQTSMQHVCTDFDRVLAPTSGIQRAGSY